MPKVSVIVPNYRHARFLPRRLESILNQTYRDFSMLILDDASDDDSREVIERYRDRPGTSIVYNDANSGSVFRQWEKGIQLTDSDYVWIAESDDWADPGFLSRLVPLLDEHASVSVAYAQSWLADPQDNVTGDALCWTEDLDRLRWKTDYIARGPDEITDFLLVKNTIPNASAVLMRRQSLDLVRPIDARYRLCGDWWHWIRMLLVGDVAYVSDHLNYWRLQSSNARTSPPGELEWLEGEPILTQACARLGLSAADCDRILLRFLRKCWQWQREARVSGRA